jgi:hypothetical protein
MMWVPALTFNIRLWRLKNSEYDKARYRKNRAVQIRRNFLWRRKHPGYIKAYSLNWRLKYPLQKMFVAAKCRSKRKGILFNLQSWRDIPPIPKICPVLGIKIRVVVGMGHRQDTPSLDRINSTEGYKPGNVRVISRKANSLKGNATPEEMILIGKDGRRILRSSRDKNKRHS